ncbi:cation:proton antiporter [Aeromonas jandaei]|uniref:Cation:proton antiporter n=2 Tax=Aeromonas TaxID=642 RepID=A0ABD7ELC6_AERJA|nr:MULTISPECIES: monovalent cation:proton antiporter family protein [Aeromonas]MBL0597926.1 cation:proton antiporter [Aeromonas jandaei]MCQ4053800.1 cation:proton antiporter [Aeromonas sp. SG16]QTL92589.1 Glutathione-regulated potassium-efflux system protein KefC [Aeromonas jandaei]QWL62025.1 cation:proton antiporter [Aeromonas jandaei]QXC39756.1 cation:proton antiporter [Aeromonas sp. FDAARGOS 1410]
MYTDLLILLFAAVLLVAIFRRFGLPVILAYLIAGVLLGPHGLAVITGQSIMQTIAELGIVFLMFSLGLEFSLPKLLAMRYLVLGVGGLQVLLTSLLFFWFGWHLGLSLAQALVVGGTLALSSTAVVIKQLGEQKQLHTRRAQLGVSVLLFQDLAVVPLLVMIPILAEPQVQGSALAAEIAWAILKGLFALLSLLAVGKWLLPLLFHEVARARSDELFVLSALLVALLAAFMTYSLGLSMALGAFLAGMMLGESHYRHQLEVDIKPFRDVLMGLFFITIGMNMDWVLVAQAWWQVLLCVVVLVLCKSLLVLLAGRLMGERKRDSMAAGIMLSQVGEFGFVLLALALHHGLLDPQLVSRLIGIGIISIAMTPWLVTQAHSLARSLTDPALLTRSEVAQSGLSKSQHVIIAGFGRAGQTCARFLKLEEIPFLALDLDPERVSEAKQAGEQVAFGDASRRDILLAAGLLRARLVIITFDDRKRVEAMLALIRELAGELKVLVRTRDDSFLEQYKQAGAFEVIPESQEGALMLVSHLLVNCDIPLGRVIRRMEHERSSQYRFLHGFYWGDQSANNLEADQLLERLHPLMLHDQAWAVGREVRELPLDEVRIKEVQRGDQMLEPRDELTLQAGDRLILFGTAVAIEQAEQRLLEGR